MKLSLCIICKNEEKKIARCIQSVKEKVDEIIVVDTGSTDQTIDIVKKLGAKVFEIPWEADFSKARNYAISRSKGNWIIFLDADEYLMTSSLKDLRNHILQAENMKKDAILSEMINEEEGRIQSTFKTIRIFKHNPKIMYKGRIHETLCKEDGLEAVDFSEHIRILHDGYSEACVEEKNKEDRNLEMLLKEYETNPTSSDLCYYLMEDYNGKNDLEQTWMFGQKALAYNNSTLVGIRQATYSRLLDTCHKMKKAPEEMGKLYQEAIKCDGEYPDFDFRYACYFYERKEYELVIEHLKICLSKMEKYKGTIASRVMGNLISVLQLLTQCYIAQEKLQEAIPLLVKILRINPYEYTSLCTLIEILGTAETGEAIGGFLKKLYNFNSTKDQMVLAQISQKAGNQDLYNYIIKELSKDAKEKLGIK